MKLEKALPLLRKGKSIKRAKKSSTMIVKFASGKYLNCKYLYNSGKEFIDFCYNFTNEDLIADNWEIVE
jgi:hypothetical protein